MTDDTDTRDDDLVLTILVRRDGTFTYSGMGDERPTKVPALLREMARVIEEGHTIQEGGTT